MPKPSLADFLHLHFLVVIWGFTAILGLLLVPMPYVAVVFYRTALATLGLLMIVLLRGQSLEMSAGDRWKLLATGGIIGLHWLAFFGAARLANASVCLAGMATSSLWASVLEPLLLRRRVRGLEVFMGAVVMAGLYVVFRFSFDKWAGLALAVVSAGLASLFTVVNSRFVKRHAPLTISLHEMAGAFLLVVPFMIGQRFMMTTPNNVAFWPTLPQWGWLLLLAGVCTVYAYTAGVQLLRKFSPYMAVLTVNLEPVYGIMLAVLIFGQSEQMTPGFYVGTLIILLAVLSYPYLERRFARPAEVPAPTP